MGIGELIGALGGEAERQRAAIRERAEAEAAGIAREAEAAGARLLEGAGERGEDAARAEAARVLGRARLAARRQLLAARHAVLEEAFAALEERLRSLLGTPAYHEALGVLLREGADAAAGPLTVRCRPEDRAAVEGHARALGIAVAVKEAPLVLGGVETATGPEGRLVCRNGIADRVDAARSLLLQVAGRTLFGEHPGAEGGAEGGT